MAMWIGIDVSMDTLDIGWHLYGQRFAKKVSNDEKGFEAIIAAVPADAHFVMEATGSYSFDFAHFLHEQGRYVACVNPAMTCFYARSELSRTKSDKSDAFSIARFGQDRQPPRWKPVSREVIELRQLQAFYDQLTCQLTQHSNHAHAIKRTKFRSQNALDLIDEVELFLSAQMEKTLKKMEALAMVSMSRTVEVLQSIPGIGLKSSVRMAAAVGDFNDFEGPRNLASFVGLTPLTQQSGISVKSRGHMSRMGGVRIRGALYMCAVVASRYNPQCKALKDRMKKAGKPGKVIIVAIMNKLIRIMHSLVVHDCLYDPNFGLKNA